MRFAALIFQAKVEQNKRRNGIDFDIFNMLIQVEDNFPARFVNEDHGHALLCIVSYYIILY